MTVEASAVRRSVFVDTSALVALLSPRDPYHARALATVDRLNEESSPLLTTNFVLAETHGLLTSQVGSRTATRHLIELDHGAIVVLRVTTDDESAARRILLRYEDNGFSLTDSTSFAIMQRVGTVRAFAYDTHFAQMGFEMVAQHQR